ncbi:hypothetical protein [Moraxella sp. RCAD0137]|uniref:hypothetical protein n=1 Tax=Moraxella sp. RCAD0137 TaxID=1775913 RepID=UPI000CB88DF9|nr:hypothetical protein [Moraxella sp. RCAD0137]PNP98505.1 hypothetical protein AZ602_02485 [Moraxella sp. RCAD0137]
MTITKFKPFTIFIKAGIAIDKPFVATCDQLIDFIFTKEQFFDTCIRTDFWWCFKKYAETKQVEF